MRFLVHVLKWCLAVLFALVPTVFVGGILSAISLIFIDEPPYGSAARSVEASNLRQIGQASLIYASDHHDRLPDAVDVPDYARLLAIDGGLNDISIWFPTGTTFGPDAWTVLQELPGQPRARWPTNPAFAHAQPLFTVVLGGLDANMPSTTPLAWTRGLDLEPGFRFWRPMVQSRRDWVSDIFTLILQQEAHFMLNSEINGLRKVTLDCFCPRFLLDQEDQSRNPG